MDANTIEFSNLVVSRYLYNQDNAPVGDQFIDEKWIRDDLAVGSAIDVPVKRYMETVGRFAILSEFPLVKSFFNLFTSIPPKYDGQGHVTYYNKQDMLTMLGLNTAALSFQQYEVSDNIDDLGLRTLIWGSVSYSNSDDVQFWVDADGEKSVKNYYVAPRQFVETGGHKDNYDLKSSDLVTNLANTILVELQDPSNIGRTVEFNFTGTQDVRTEYNLLDYQDDVATANSWTRHNFPSVSAVTEITRSQFDNGITRFLDLNNRPILYGNNGNSISLESAFFETGLSYLNEYRANGVVIIEDSGNDYLAGGDDGDLLIGNGGDDTLLGGSGDDVLRGGDGDDRLLPGSGQDYVDGGAGFDTLDFENFGRSIFTFPVGVVAEVRTNRASSPVEISTVEFKVDSNVTQILNTELVKLTDQSDTVKVGDLGPYVSSNSSPGANNPLADLKIDFGKSGIFAENDDQIDFSETTPGSATRVISGGATQTTLNLGIRVDLGDKENQSVQYHVNWGAGEFQNSSVLATFANANSVVGTDNDDVLLGARGKKITGEGYSTLHGGAGDDYLQGAGWESHLYGDAGADTFAVGSKSFIDGSDDSDKVTYAGFQLYGGVNPWWLESGYAIWSLFATLNSYFSVAGSSLIQTAAIFSDAVTLKFASYRMTENGALEIQNAWGLGGYSILENYNLSLDTGVGSAGITVYSVLFTTAKVSAQQFGALLNLALHASNGSYFGTDPLVLDLDGDGFQLTTQLNSDVWFDFNHNGYAQHTGWVGASDGFLVRDINSNGRIDDISEMFGNSTEDGIAMLADFDSNLDGLITSSDTIYATLQIWQDLNQNGVTDAGELKTLSDMGIVSISLASVIPATAQNIAGNVISRESSFTYANGSTFKLADVVLDTSTFQTRYLGDLTISAPAGSLPILQGRGTVKDLRVAMTQSSSLLTLVQTFGTSTSTDLDTLKASAQNILYEWAGVGLLSPIAIGTSGFDTRKLAFMEKYAGTAVMTRDANGTILLDNLEEVQDLWNDQLTRLTLRLVAQGPLAAQFAGISYHADLDLFVANNSTALSDIFRRIITDLPQADHAAASALWNSWSPLLGALVESMVRSDNVVVRVDYLFAQLVRAADGVVQPLTLADLASGLSINNLKLGASGNDTLTRSTVGDTTVFFGGGGDDTSTGGTGQDVYVFGRNIGRSVINDFEAREGGDRVRFAFLNATDVTLGRDNNDLLITIKATGESIRVTGQFAAVQAIGADLFLTSNKGIEDIQFADGTIWETPEIMKAVGTGTDGDDHMIGTMHSDVFIGGKGNDFFEGGDDADLYVVNAGDGQDVISDVQTTPLLRAADMLIFGDDIAPEDIIFSRSGADGSDLSITIGSSGQSILVQNQFSYSVLGYNAHFALNSRIEAFGFREYGETWSSKDIQEKLIAQASTAGNDTILGFGDDDIIDGGKGNDTLVGLDGDDVYRWGKGDGNDTVNERALYIGVNVGLGGLALVAGTDTVDFKGLNRSDLSFARPAAANDLVITNISTGETLTILNQFGGFQTGVLGPQWMDRIERFTFADGTALSWQDVLLTVTTGGSGNDALYGDLSNDTLTGGLGNDYLSGKGYGDTYKFGVGDGQDTIEDGNNFVLGDGFVTIDEQPDILVLGPGIAPGDLRFEHVGNDIKLIIGTGGDSILLKGQDDYMQTGVFGAISANRIEQIQFANGTSWSWAELQERVIAQNTTSGNDIARGFTLEDRFEASAGDDLMMGGDSSDTYVFGIGSGHDEIRESVSNVLYGDSDAIEFGPGVGPDDLALSRDGSDLLVSIVGTSDTLRVTGQFNNYVNFTFNSVELFKFADVTIWSDIDVQNKLLQSTAGNDVITGFHTDDILAGGLGNDILRGGDGADTYIFNRGDGQDRIEESVQFVNIGNDDKLVFGAGITLADLVLSRSGNDLIIGISGTTDTITVAGQFDQFAWLALEDVENFVFDDGTSLTKDQISALLLSGTAGNDTLNGTSGNDLLDGGAGDDYLAGADGSDTYVFGRGYGHDMIHESVSQVIIGDDDRVLFKEGIVASDLIYARDGDDLIITIAGTADTLRIEGEFSYSAWFTWNDVERFEFADGSIVTKDSIRQQILSGGTTNHIVGFASDDTLEGGTGDDTLEGGDGSDTYVFGRGSGHDTIVESLNNTLTGEFDTLQFKAGIAVADVTVTRQGQDAIFTLDTGESIRVVGQFNEGYNELLSSNDVEQVTFADGTIWGKADIARLSIHASSGNDVIDGTWYTETFNGLAGDDTIHAGGRDDILIGGTGNDRLEGGGGDDTYTYNIGDGNDVILDYEFDGNGANRIKFGAGIAPGYLRFANNPADSTQMTISFANAAGSIRILNQWTGDDAIKFIDFDDGTVWDVTQIAAAFVSQQPTSGNDSVFGTSGNDRISGGTGNDMLVGSQGDDVYGFGRGDGVDTIVDIGYSHWWGNESGGNDRIEMRAGIAPADIVIAQSSADDLTLSIAGTADKLILTGAITDPLRRIEEVRFADGTIWTIDQILARSMLGTAASETINGTSGNDLISGGAGDDILQGAGGDDVYRFGRGDGSDTVIDVGPSHYWGFEPGGYDRVQMGPGITTADVRVVETSPDNITLQIIGTSDQLTLSGTVSDPARRIEEVGFADGTTWTYADLLARATAPTPGNDVFYAGDTPLSLSGGAGDDTLNGSAGNDVVAGNSGNDMLVGNGGDDVYRFDRGDGTDTIVDVGPSHYWGFEAGGYDRVQLGSGITVADIRVVETSPDNIALQIIGATDQLILSGTISDAARRIEEVAFADGTTWTYSDLLARATAPTPGDDVFYAGDTPATLSGGGGNDTLNGSAGNNILAGGTGNDLLIGNAGDDIYRFGRGDGTDTIVDVGPGHYWGYESGGIDTIELQAGISTADVRVVAVTPDNLALQIIGTTDQLILSGAITDEARRIEQVVFADGTVWTHADLIARFAADNSGDNVFNGTNAADTIDGGAGNDTIDGRNGNDVLIGGTGNDFLTGGGGDDTYRFARGDGQDRIQEAVSYDSGVGGNDTVVFAAGIAPTDVTVSQASNGQDLILSIIGTTDTITLVSALDNPTDRIEQVTFNDGTVWTSVDLVQRSTIANAGNNSFFGSHDAETLNGGAGDDTIDARDGNDILTGGTGNDFLSGSGGDDTYIFARGDGQDRIQDAISYASGVGGNDTVAFAAGIASTDVIVSQANSGQDLVLSIVGTTDTVTLVSTISNPTDRIEQVTFSDGTVWTHADLMARSVASNSGNDTFNGTNDDDTIDGGAGNDTIDARNGNDILIGGTGNDFLSGGGGNDTYRFARGDGQDTVQDAISYDSGVGGNDTIVFAVGIAPTDISVSQMSGGEDLLLSIAGSTDSIRLVYTITNPTDRIEQVTFSDGTIWTHADLMARATTPTSGDDVFYAGGEGQILSGGAGNDTLTGRVGNDVLVGGIGNDILSGGGGDDTYRFARGDGQDRIQDSISYANGVSGNDTVAFDAGIAPADILVTQGNSGQDLVLSIDGTVDKLTLFTAISNSTNTIEQVTFNNGTIWTADDLFAKSLLGSSADDNLYGNASANVLRGGAGNDTLSGGGGSDTFVYHDGFGTDTITDFDASGSSPDTLQFDTSMFSDWAHLLGATQQVGADLTITLDATDTLTLKNVAVANFTAANATFV